MYFLSINYPNQYKEFDYNTNTKSINNYSSTINIKKKIEYEINIMKNMLIGYIDRKAISLLDTLYISKLDTIYLVKNIKI